MRMASIRQKHLIDEMLRNGDIPQYAYDKVLNEFYLGTISFDYQIKSLIQQEIIETLFGYFNGLVNGGLA